MHTITHTFDFYDMMRHDAASTYLSNADVYLLSRAASDSVRKLNAFEQS